MTLPADITTPTMTSPSTADVSVAEMTSSAVQSIDLSKMTASLRIGSVEETSSSLAISSPEITSQDLSIDSVPMTSSVSEMTSSAPLDVTDVSFGRACEADAEALCRLDEETEWYNGRTVLDMWIKYYSQGFFVARISDRVIGCILCHCLDKEEAFVGMWVVREEYRGYGIGRRLWTIMRAHAGDRNIGLNTEFQHASLLHRLGFTVQGQGRSLTVFATREKLISNFQKLRVDTPYEYELEIESLSPDDMDKLVQYDEGIFRRRKDFLSHFFSCGTTIVFVAKKVGEMVGYVDAWIDAEGYLVLGPLYADSDYIFEKLMEEIIDHMILTGTPGLSADINADSDAAMTLFTRIVTWTPSRRNSLVTTKHMVIADPSEADDDVIDHLISPQLRRSSYTLRPKDVDLKVLQNHERTDTREKVTYPEGDRVSVVNVQLYTKRDCDVDWKRVYCLSNTEMMAC